MKRYLVLVTMFFPSYLFSATYDDTSRDITNSFSFAVQSTSEKSLSLASGLSDHRANIFINPALAFEYSGVFIEGDRYRENLYAGGIASPRSSLKVGLFLNVPENEQATINTFAREPRYGKNVSLNQMIPSGSTVLGVIDPSSVYFKSDTVSAGEKSPVDLVNADDGSNSLKGFNAFAAYDFGIISAGLMIGYSACDNSESDTLSEGSSRSVSFSSEMIRIITGVKVKPTEKLSTEFAVNYSVPSVSYLYKASASSTYAVVSQQNTNEYLKFKSIDPLEAGFTLRASYNKSFYGVLTYLKSEMPVLFSGKLASQSNPAVHTIMYNDQRTLVKFDGSWHLDIIEKMRLITSFGLMQCKETLSKKTETLPSGSSDGSIFGNTVVDDRRNITLRVVSVGLAEQYSYAENMIISLGAKTHIYASEKSDYSGISQSSGSSESTVQQGIIYLSAGCMYKQSKDITINVLLETNSSGRDGSDSDKLPLNIGGSIDYSF